MLKTRQTFSIYVIGALMAVGAAIYAQNSASSGEAPGAGTQDNQKREMELKEKHLVATVGNTVYAFEIFHELEHRIGDKLVKGAPFSAQVVIEKTQTLTGGVHMSHKVTGALYRDAEGRTRQEEPREGAPEIVLINDPASGVLYNLNMFQKTAQKVAYQALKQKQEHERREHREMEEHVRREIEERARLEGRGDESAHSAEPEKRIEALGTQMIEGVQVTGTRVTVTIPAGREGNDQPFDIVSEKWYSPDLQIAVVTRHSDPRSGEHVYRLTNISRNEPSRSLFEAPSDFTVREEKMEPRKH